MDPMTYLNLSIIALFGLVWIGFAAFLRFKKRKSLIYLIIFSLFLVYILKVLDYTLFQFQSLIILKHFSPNLILKGQSAGESLNLIPLMTLGAGDLKTSLLNVLLFVPFGFGFPLISSFGAKKTVAIGGLFSIAIELLQFMTGKMSGISFRIADINDVISNIAGAAIGYILFVGFVNIIHQISSENNISNNSFVKYIKERPQVKNI
jgi:glycopeptide antibiotics resistance protein